VAKTEPDVIEYEMGGTLNIENFQNIRVGLTFRTTVPPGGDRMEATKALGEDVFRALKSEIDARVHDLVPFMDAMRAKVASSS
jgi:hypothetical protein